MEKEADKLIQILLDLNKYAYERNKESIKRDVILFFMIILLIIITLI